MNASTLARVTMLLALALSACSARATLPQAGISAGDSVEQMQSNRTLAAQASGYAQLFRFAGPTNAGGPLASLVNVNSTLYGTTVGGGDVKCGTSGGCGAVFAFQPASKEASAVYSFTNGLTTGRNPRSNLIAFNGKLYGTTYWGGNTTPSCRPKTTGCGVVFRVDPASGKEEVLYAFKGGASDGSNPAAGLLALNGTLYGVTTIGGNTCGHTKASCGTIFSIDPSSGKEKVEYRFKSADGTNPLGTLIAVGNTLYGTTSAGGSGAQCPSDTPGCGTVFSFDVTTSAFRVLHAFNGVTDGESPRAPLVAVNGRLYGTTALGGSMGAGVLFSVVRTTGSERTVHTFEGKKDGAEPLAGLVNYKGELYGTTMLGGGKNNAGTVFSVNIASGQERILHGFVSGLDGASPVAALVRVNGTLYGTTAAKTGKYDGTIFSITP